MNGERRFERQLPKQSMKQALVLGIVNEVSVKRLRAKTWNTLVYSSLVCPYPTSGIPVGCNTTKA